MRTLSGADVMPQVLALGIGRYAAPQVIGECWKWKAWRRGNLQSSIRLAPLLERKIAPDQTGPGRRWGGEFRRPALRTWNPGRISELD